MISLLTVIRVLDSAVISQPCATFGFLQHVLVSVRFALRRSLQLLHHILELLQQLTQLELQLCGKCDHIGEKTLYASGRKC